jgi:hypothetical protein
VIYEERKPRQNFDYATRGDSRYNPDPSTIRGFAGHVDSMILEPNCGGGSGGPSRRRANTSYAESSSTGFYPGDSELNESMYYLVDGDDDDDYDDRCYSPITSSYETSIPGHVMR